jgi:iron complex transport system substrate-binding protein
LRQKSEEFLKTSLQIVHNPNDAPRRSYNYRWFMQLGLGSYPQRIICLTEETTEVLYLLGEQDRIVGISGYTVRPPEARQKPKVSAFINAKFDKILALEPDLVFAFSDLQADIAAELIRRGTNVCTFNQRSVAEILQMILTVGRIVNRAGRRRATCPAPPKRS